MTLPVVQFDHLNATEEELRAMHAFGRQLQHERSPDDPPLPFEQMVANLRNIPPFVEIFLFHVPLSDGRIGASAHFGMLKTPENRHLGQISIEVLPELRRQGIATRLLAELVPLAETHERRMLMSHTSDRVPAGGAFLERIGGKVALESHTNQLMLEELDRGMLGRWLDVDLTDEFALGFWDGPYPEQNIDEIVALNELMNQVPHGDLDIEDFHWTAEQLRQEEKSMEAQGTVRWTAYVRDLANNHIAGFTATFWEPHRPTHMQQGITAVWPQYRGKGLGRWLKAAMMDRILRERPEVTLIRTNNADMNAPMLKINTELGFRPYRADFTYQVETTRARQYLNERQATTD